MSRKKKGIILDTSVILNLFERVITKAEHLQKFLFTQFDIYTTPKVIEEATRSKKSSLSINFMESTAGVMSPEYNKEN